MADEKKPVDWAEIERDYRTGTMSIRELAAWYGLSDTAIRKRAKADGWVRENADHGSRRQPAPEIEPKIYVGTVLTPENADPEVIVGRGRNLVLRMLDELDASTCRVGEMESLIEQAMDGAQDRAKEAAYQSITLKTRSDVLKALATAAKTLGESTLGQGVKAERQRRGDAVAKGESKYASPAAPLRLVQ